MIVDSHVHIWEIPPVAPIGPTAPNWTALPDEAGSAELLIDDMVAHGVDRAVLVQTSWSTWDNGYVADASRRYPDRFVSMGLINPLDPGNAEQVSYWMDVRGMAGFRFHPQYYPDVPILTRPENLPMFRAIEDRGGVVQVHSRAEHADQLDSVAEQWPGITWLIDHMMYPEPDMAPHWEAYRPVVDLARHANVHIKISDVHNRSRQGFPFSDMHDVVKMAIEAFGIERCIWGTGYPGYHREKHGWPSLADELRLVKEGFGWLTENEQARLLGINASRIWAFESPDR